MKRKNMICLLLLIAFILLLWLKGHRSPQLLGRCVHRINTSEKVVALTFDDGPSFYTEEILDILHLYKAQATFFLLGQNIEQFPSLVQQIYKKGHEIGNHSYSHQPLIFKSCAFIREEIEKTDQLIKKSGYQGIIHFRAPYGRKLFGLPWILYKSKRPHILFDVIPDDWACPGVATIVNRILAQTKPGSIILFHDGNGDNITQDRSQTVQALSIILKKLKADGYQFVTISELLNKTSLRSSATKTS